MNNNIKVLVVDDSSLFRQALIQHLSSQPGIEVIGYAINAYDAKQKIPQLQPDVLTLDVEMPGLNGIEFLKQLLPTNPLPVVLVSSLNLSVFDALSAGAVDFVRKPDMSVHNSKQTFFEALTAKVTTAGKGAYQPAGRRGPRFTSSGAGNSARRRTSAYRPRHGKADAISCAVA